MLTRLDVVLWDERLSSRAAERALREAGVRGNKRKQTVDRVAAALILQSYLDAQRERDGDGDDGGALNRNIVRRRGHRRRAGGAGSAGCCRSRSCWCARWLRCSAG